MATIYGKVNCFTRYSMSGYSSPINSATMSCLYANLYDFMEYLRINGVAELVTRQGGYDYPDLTGSNQVAATSFSVWKMKTNNSRSWEWYLYIQNCADSSFASVPPTRIITTAGALATSQTDYHNVAFAAAFSISGSSSINPWNGTIDLTGGAAKSTPVWATGSPDYSVHVFPRINNLSGSAATEKDVVTPFLRVSDLSGGTIQAVSLSHFFSDGNGILFLTEYNLSGVSASLPENYSVATYIGPFSLLDGIKQSYPTKTLGTESMGFCYITNNTGNYSMNQYLGTSYDLFAEKKDIGSLTPTTAGSKNEGGFFVASDIGVRIGAISTDSSTNTAPYQTNSFTGKIDGRHFTVYGTEPGFEGMMGHLDSPLFRSMGSIALPTTYTTSSAGDLAIFGGTNAAKARIITPWSGSIPGTGSSQGTNALRSGTKFIKAGFNF